MFIDIRDFTPYAEANTAEDTVARLNALFEVVVPAVVDAGGHVNKFLGDGALAVFGARTTLLIMPTRRCLPRCRFIDSLPNDSAARFGSASESIPGL